MKNFIVLPTFNESENIARLMEALLKTIPDSFVCVVDDNSPDKTADVVRSFQKSCSDLFKRRTHLIVREKKDGRGGAVRAGFEFGLSHPESNFENFVEMDCDFSHAPEDLLKGLDLLKDYDVALGSRYPFGKIVGWPAHRRLLSFGANTLARTLISNKIGDYTSGFRCYRRGATELLCRVDQRHKGYIYLSETLAYLIRKGCKIGAFPITFVNRERGVSNTTLKEVSNSLTGILEIAWNFHFGKNEPRL